MGKIGQNPKIGQLWRPVAPQPYVVAVQPDPRNSLALGLQCGVNNISHQCITWPVAYFEWGACLTDFDRLSIFRFRHPDYDPDRAQKLTSSSMSRHLSTCDISSKSIHAFLSNLAHSQTDRQTDRQTDELERAGANIICFRPTKEEVYYTSSFVGGK